MPKLHIYVTNDDGYESEVTIRELSEEQLRLFRISSIERVINTSMRLIEDIPETEDNKDSISINLEDWVEWKPVIVSLWTGLQNALFQFPFKTRSRTTTGG